MTLTYVSTRRRREDVPEGMRKSASAVQERLKDCEVIY